MRKPDERQILRDILKTISELMAETRLNRTELNDLQKEIQAAYDKKQISLLGFDLRREQIRRSCQNIDYCMRSLERQRKIAQQKLQDLPLP